VDDDDDDDDVDLGPYSEMVLNKSSIRFFLLPGYNLHSLVHGLTLPEVLLSFLWKKSFTRNVGQCPT